MKGRLIALLGICIAILIVLGPDAQGKKPDNPDKPGKTQSELITFTGDLEGEGCCWKDGVFQEYWYSMTLSFDVGDEEAGTFIPAGTAIYGQLWINHGHGTGRKEYIVHFWWGDGDAEIVIEIIGGVIFHDRKNEKVTVIFTNEVCVDYFTKEIIAEEVNFMLERSPD